MQVRVSLQHLGSEGKRAPAIFFRTEAGGEPVREWLKGLFHKENAEDA